MLSTALLYFILKKRRNMKIMCSIFLVMQFQLISISKKFSIIFIFILRLSVVINFTILNVEEVFNLFSLEHFENIKQSLPININIYKSSISGEYIYETFYHYNKTIYLEVKY